MAHSKDTRDALRRLYIEGLPLKGAAATHGVSYETARNWKAADEAAGASWDAARSALSLSGHGIEKINEALIEKIARHALAVTQELEGAQIDPVQKVDLLTQLADAYAKFSRAFARVNPQMGGLAIALEVVKTLAEHLRKTDPDALHVLQAHLDALGPVLTQRFGGKA